VRRTKATATEVPATASETTTTEASSAAEVSATETTTMKASSTPAVATRPPGLSEGDRCDAD